MKQCEFYQGPDGAIVLSSLCTTTYSPEYAMPISKAVAPYAALNITKSDLAKFTKITPKEAIFQVGDKLPLAQMYIISKYSWVTGGDPEIFVFDKAGKVIPAWNFLPKTHLHGPMSAPGYAQAIWDGVQAEVNARQVGCHAYFIDYIRKGLKDILTAAQKFNPDAVLECKDVVKVPLTIRKTATEEQIQLGCAPSLNAYGTPPLEIGDGRKHIYRYSGVHTHHSIAGATSSKYKEPDWWPNGTVIAMDKICGLMLTALGRDLEDPKRREAYGRPGEYRIPSDTDFRLEYRTPGAFTLISPEVYHLTLELARTAYILGFAADGNDLPIPDVKDIITNCDADAAVKLLKKHHVFYENVLARWCSKYKETMEFVYKGLKASKTSLDVAANWHIRPNDKWLDHSNNDRKTWNAFIMAHS